MGYYPAKIGFMQGRLSPLIRGKIQAFPWEYWKQEFHIAQKYEFNCLEWVLDQYQLYKNPLMTKKGREEIESLMLEYNISIISLTGDCFMQKPFFKASKKHRDNLLKDLKEIIYSCFLLGIRIIVFPLVDGGSIENNIQERILINELNSIVPLLEETNTVICFESDFNAKRLLNFIDHFEPKYFGINYDIGNSASFGYLPKEEIELYGDRIINVHVKDRLLHGTTVPLGEGDADIATVLESLIRINYSGNYILQTARAANNNHVNVLTKYRDFIIKLFGSVGDNR